MADLLGYVRISKRIRQHAIWQRPDYAIAWIDLIILANDQPRETFIKGKAVRLDRGQLAWSLKSLEKEWGKSHDWVASLMNFLKDHDMVKVDSDHCRTIITVMNYGAYNPIETKIEENKGTEPTTEPISEPRTEPTTEPIQKVELGTGNKKGEAPPVMALSYNLSKFAEAPGDDEVQTYCAYFVDLARGINGIPESWWRGWVANRLVPNPALNKDWQRALRNEFLRDVARRHPSAFQNSSGQAGTPETEKKSAALDGRSLPQARFEIAKALEAVRDRLEAAYQLDQPGEPGDKARERELMAQLELLGT